MALRAAHADPGTAAGAASSGCAESPIPGVRVGGAHRPRGGRAEAALAFAFFSMVITYFLSAYSSLTSRKAFAQGLHHLSGNTGDAGELIARLADGGELSAARQHLAAKADSLRQTHQTHRFYPVLRYSHHREPYYALPRVLLIALDTATLIRSALDPAHHGRLMHSPSLNGLSEAAMDLMHELVPGAQPAPPSEREARGWREHYRAAHAWAGVSPTP